MASPFRVPHSSVHIESTRVTHKSIHITPTGNERYRIDVYVNGKRDCSYCPCSLEEAEQLADRLVNNECPRCKPREIADYLQK